MQLINGDETLQADEELEMEMGQENSAGPETERGRMDDPVKMYLKEIGKVRLLSYEDEIRLAQQIGRAHV